MANKLLSPLGIALVRTEKTPWLRKTTEIVQVGSYSIQMPGISPLVKCYSQFPESVGHLGRLASLLKEKYLHLGAIDIGANVGDTACIIKSSADIPLLCIEGDDFCFGFLEKNVKQFQKVAVHKLFLGEKTGIISAAFEKTGWNTTIKPGNGVSAKKINVTSLDDFLATQPDAANFKLIKIDTEGFDCAIIRGGAKFIQKTHPVIAFEYNRDNMEALGEKGLDTLLLLSSLGYSQVVFHDCAGRFFCPATLSNQSLIKDLHDYADGRHGAIYYFDLTVFHENDSDVAKAFVSAERMWRTG
ncbi:MAG: FkbM family methyltransferase [Verrucomicrobiota bacterium]